MSAPLSPGRRAAVAAGAMGVPATWAGVWAAVDLDGRWPFLFAAGLLAVACAAAAGALNRLVPAVLGVGVLGGVAAAARAGTDPTRPGAVVGTVALGVLLLGALELIDQLLRGGVQADGGPVALAMLVPPLLVGAVGAVAVGTTGAVRFDGTVWVVLAGAAALVSLAWPVRELLRRAGR